MLRARCPSCGKSASFGDADAGQPVVCLACGARYLAPDPLAPATATDVESAPESAPVSGGPRVGRMFWVALVLGVVSGAGVLALVLRGGHGNPTNSVDTATVLTLASEARAAADAGRYVEAHQKYQQLESSLAGRDVNDPDVRRTVEQAMADKQRVYAVLLSQPGADQPQTSAI